MQSRVHSLLTTTSYVTKASLSYAGSPPSTLQATMSRTDSGTISYPLFLIVSALCTGAAGRSMVIKEQPVATSEVLDANVAKACRAELDDVVGCVEARLARVEALKLAGDLTTALSELKACRDLDPAQFAPLAKTGPGRDLRMLGLAVSKMTEGDRQLMLAESSAKSGDRENSRVLFQQGISTLDAAIHDIQLLRLGTSQPVQDLLMELRSKVRYEF